MAECMTEEKNWRKKEQKIEGMSWKTEGEKKEKTQSKKVRRQELK